MKTSNIILIAIFLILNFSSTFTFADDSNIYNIYNQISTLDDEKLNNNLKIKLANAGDSQAQLELGDMYYIGDKIRQDYNQAYYWYSKAAEQGIEVAKKYLIYMYEHNQGVQQNHDHATLNYQRFKNQTSYDSTSLKPRLIEEDLEVKSELFDAESILDNVELEITIDSYLPIIATDESTELIKNLAHGGDIFSQWLLGFMYEKGYGVAKNYTYAKDWYGLACDNGYSKGCYYYKQLKLNNH